MWDRAKGLTSRFQSRETLSIPAGYAAASIVHVATGALNQVREMLRHTKVSTTGDIYTHLTEDVAKLAPEILAREISGAFSFIFRLSLLLIFRHMIGNYLPQYFGSIH